MVLYAPYKNQKDGHYRIYAVTNSNLILLCSFRETNIHEILQLETPKTFLLFYVFFTKKIFFSIRVFREIIQNTVLIYSQFILFSLKQCR